MGHFGREFELGLRAPDLFPVASEPKRLDPKCHTILRISEDGPSNPDVDLWYAVSD